MDRMPFLSSNLPNGSSRGRTAGHSLTSYPGLFNVISVTCVFFTPEATVNITCVFFTPEAIVNNTCVFFTPEATVNVTCVFFTPEATVNVACVFFAPEAIVNITCCLPFSSATTLHLRNRCLVHSQKNSFAGHQL